MAEAASPQREFPFSNRDFEEVRKMIYDHAGIALNEAKEDMVYSRLARRLRATGKRSFPEYLDLIRSGDAAEWEAFVNSLTTNLTDFFREAHHFHILKDFLKTRKDRPITIWSSASSTGEEPYSIAITALEAMGRNAPVQILASDLDTNVLKKAEAGVYPIERLAKLSAEQQRHFFLKGTGENAGMARAKPELRAMLNCFRLNLLDTVWSIRQPLDAIFCRNVMIYFDKKTQEGLVNRFHSRLAKGGYLFIGHSESLTGLNHAFKYLEPSLYRK